MKLEEADRAIACALLSYLIYFYLKRSSERRKNEISIKNVQIYQILATFTAPKVAFRKNFENSDKFIPSVRYKNYQFESD